MVLSWKRVEWLTLGSGTRCSKRRSSSMSVTDEGSGCHCSDGSWVTKFKDRILPSPFATLVWGSSRVVWAVQGKSSNAITYQSVRNKALCVKSKHFVCRVLIGFPIAQEVLHWQPTTPTLHVRPTAHAANANNMTNNFCLTCSRPQHWHVSALCASFSPLKTYFLLFQKFLNKEAFCASHC